MAAIGEKYDFDVFFSYAWAAEATEDDHLRNWCRAVADGISTLLRQRFNASKRRFSAYLDRDHSKSGDALSETLERATRRSAVFVAMVSDYYESGWCQKEQDWFCDQIAAEGVALADHVFIIRVQAPSEGVWPKRLAGVDGTPLRYCDFCNPHGQPINMAEFMLRVPTPGLAWPIEQAALEIGEKLKAIETKVRARAEYESSRLPPEGSVLYFEAERQDVERWSACGRVLQEVPSIILPAEGPVAANEVGSDAPFADCDGLVLLRTRHGDNIVPRVKRAFRDLRQINSAHKIAGRPEVPWALLDELDEAPPPDIAPFKIRRVQARGDWAPEIRKALFDA
jgi:hypothetical protein